MCTLTRQMRASAVATIKAAGYVPEIVIGRHVKVRWIDHTGRRRQLIQPATPSDQRALLNSRSVLHRLLSGAVST
jgi:hypothetical protein